MRINSIQRLVSNGHYKEALALYTKSHSSSLQPTIFTFPFLLKSCTHLQLTPPLSQQVHTHIIKCGFQSHTYTATALINTYMKLGLFEDALNLFESIPHPTIPSLNAIISGFSQLRHFEESIYYFKCINLEGFLPSSISIAGVLPACQMLEHGSQIHGLSMKLGHELDVYVATALFTMYSNCGEMGSAQLVFGMVENKSIVSYNAMLSGLLENGQFSMALNLFRDVMGLSGVRPTTSTLLNLLSICSKLSALMLGKEIHCYSLKCELISDTMIGTTLVDMYSKCGSLSWAYRVFMAMEKRKSLTTWNAMISGLLSGGHVDLAVALFYKLRLEGLMPDSATWNLMINGFSRQGNATEAFKLFTEMQSEGILNPSLKAVTSILQACSSISNLQKGKEIHCHVTRTNAGSEDEFLHTALITMYMNCGCASHARTIFDQFERKSGDPAIWNAMITGYGRNGESDLATGIFLQMQEKRVKPNSTTFLSILSVCCHTGKVEKGWQLFKMMMSEEYGIDPTEEHLGCIIDLFGRAGKLEEAWDLINEMRSKPKASVYHSLLGACKYYSDVRIGEMVAERLSELEPWNPAPFVILSSLYAVQGRWDEAENLRKVMEDKGLIKVPGRSWRG